MLNDNKKKNIEDLISTYPRPRPPLSSEMADAFDQIYKENRQRKTFIQKISEYLESWMHKKISETPGKRLLEIGAGTLNHVKYERSYETYDIIEPFTDLYKESPEIEFISHRHKHIDDLDQMTKYDKIFSVATLEHITDLPYYIGKSAHHLQKNGVFQAGIPSEGGLLWGLSWRISSGLSIKLRTGLDWSEYMRHEHINNANEILQLIRFVFGEVNILRFPMPLHHISLYVLIQARFPQQEIYRKLLSP